MYYVYDKLDLCLWVRGAVDSADEKVTKCHIRGEVAVDEVNEADLKTKYYGCVAQLVAQLTLNQLVLGSSPSTPK